MNKILLNGYDSFVSFVDAHTGIIPGHGRVVSDFWVGPENILVWLFGVLGMMGMDQMSYMESLSI